MRETLRRLIGSRRWETAIITIIVLNAITLGLETSPVVMAAAGGLLVVLDRVFLTIFVIEIVVRIYAFGWRFFRDPWSIFDFLIVTISLVPATGPLTVLRALRVLRVLRLISMVPSLKRVVGGLVAALPGMGSIVVLLVLVFYVFAVMATKLYGASFPEWFGSLDASVYTLFQIMTLDSWSTGIVRPMLEAHPFAWAFFVPFILCTAFTVLNLFIGVIVSAMQSEHESSAEADRQAMHSETETVLRELRDLRREIEGMRDSLQASGMRP